MTKEELFKKYSINETHKEWDNAIDSWMSIEVYRHEHDGNLPPDDDLSVGWVTDYLDKTNSGKYNAEMFTNPDFGSMYLTAKRMVYKFAEQLIREE